MFAILLNDNEMLLFSLLFGFGLSFKQTLMSRPLRIEYSDAWYHVMNRGRRGETIFIDDDDYKLFLKVMEEAVGLWNVHICGYCLMPNHSPRLI